jgi:hypothetical protein
MAPSDAVKVSSCPTENGGGQVEPRFETFDANDRFVVVRDDVGYGVWKIEELEDGDPIERFANDDAGYELAAARWKQLTREERVHVDR